MKGQSAVETAVAKLPHNDISLEAHVRHLALGTRGRIRARTVGRVKKRMYKYVITCPEARKDPEGEQARHETLSEWPERNV